MKHSKQALLVLLGCGLLVAAVVSAEEEYEQSWGSREWSESGEHRWKSVLPRGGGEGVAPVNDELYAKECGACHVAYPPGLLPAKSWEKLLSQLGQHFGDNAELLPDDQAKIRQYVLANAADRSSYGESLEIVSSLGKDETPPAHYPGALYQGPSP